VLSVVAIAVVKREAHETAAEVLFIEPAMHLVERDDVKVRAPQLANHVFEELRRDFEQSVRLECFWARRAHMMQSKDCANAAEHWAQHPMSAREIERLHSGPQDDLFHMSRCLGRFGNHTRCRVRRTKAGLCTTRCLQLDAVTNELDWNLSPSRGFQEVPRLA